MLALVVAKPRAWCRAPSFIQSPILDDLDDPPAFKKPAWLLKFGRVGRVGRYFLYSNLKKDRKRVRDMRSLHSADRRRCWSTVWIK